MLILSDIQAFDVAEQQRGLFVTCYYVTQLIVSHGSSDRRCSARLQDPSSTVALTAVWSTASTPRDPRAPQLPASVPWCVCFAAPHTLLKREIHAKTAIKQHHIPTKSIATLSGCVFFAQVLGTFPHPARGILAMACANGGCAAAVPSGSEAYAKLYPEKSSDGVLRLGNVVPGEAPTARLVVMAVTLQVSADELSALQQYFPFGPEWQPEIAYC